MTEYNLKRTPEHGSLDEVVGEIIVSKHENFSIIPYPFATGMGLGLILAGAGGIIFYSIDMLKDYLLR